MRKRTKIISSLIFTAFLLLFFSINFVSAFDSSSNIEYGLLYNWYAVNDSRGLCPEGWHVPSYTEFQTFHDYLEPVSYFYMDYKIKEIGTAHWESPNDATDETGFSALGSGMRTYTGLFIELKERTDFISSSPFSELYPDRPEDCFEIYLSSYGSGDIWLGANRKKAGGSVRCIRDNSDNWEEGDLVFDYDGNVYNAVQIGTQIWLKQNLAVTHYNNGDEIPEVVSNSEWAALTTGALCAYDNNWDYVFEEALPYIPLLSCGTLSEEGETYILNSNVTSEGTCFNITSPGITLDCNGYWINYSTRGLANTNGVYTNQNYVNIRNCNIVEGNEGGQYSYGIYLKSSNNSVLKNNIVKAVSWMSGGIALGGSSNNLLINNSGQSNYIAGILINYFYNSTSSQYYYSLNNTLINNTGINKGLFPNVYFSAIQISGSDNTIINNRGIGMNIPGSGMSVSGSNNLIAENTGISDFRYGITLSGLNNVVTGNIGRGGNISGAYGLGFSNFLNNVIIENTGITSSSPGIFFFNSSNNLLIGNTAISNGASVGESGIQFYLCSNNTLINFTVRSLGGTGIYVDNSSNNLFKDSTIGEGLSLIPVYYNEYSSSINNTLINCTYYTSKNEIVQGAESELIREWYYNAQVKDSSNNPLSGVNISAFNNLGELQFSALTDSSGKISRQEVIDYINLGGTRTYYSNYNVSASKIGYTSGIHTLNFTSEQNKINDIFTLNIADTTSPKLIINSPLNNGVYKRPVLFKVTAIDDSGIKSCVYSLDFKKNATMTNLYEDYWVSTNYLVSRGWHSVTFYCTDNSELVSSQKSYFRVK